MAARSGVDAMRATARDGRDADEASPMGAGGSGARQGWGRGMAGALGAGGRRKAKLGSGAGGAWVQDAGGGSFLAQWDGCCRRRLLRGWLCREGENEKETAYAASLR